MELMYEIGEIHGLIITITVLVILYSDHEGYKYFTGKKQLLSETFIRWSHSIVWAGLILAIATGAMLLAPTLEYRLGQGVFYLKMAFVLVLLMNAFAIGKLSRKASITPFAELTSEEQKTLFVSGALSAMGWVGAIIIGLFFL